MSPDTLEGAQRILAVRLDNIGDVIMLGPALRAVKRAVPEAEITLLASRAGASVAPLVPHLDDVVTFRPLWQDISGTMSTDLQPERALAADLAARRFDAALIFTSFAQSPYPPARVCVEAGIPVRVGQSKEFGGGYLTTWLRALPDDAHQVDRNLYLVRSLGVPDAGTHMELRVPKDLAEATDHLLADAGIGPDAPFALLAPGASCDARSYGVEQFAAVAHRLAEHSGLRVVLVGSPKEVAMCEAVRSAAGTQNVINLAEASDVPTLAALTKRAAVVLGNNSAPAHIADALGTPVLLTYSGTDLESQWAPRHAPARLLRREADCSPCYRFTCDIGKPCLAISPEEVARAALELAKSRVGSALAAAG